MRESFGLERVVIVGDRGMITARASRRRKRQESLAATEKLLDKLAVATQRTRKPQAGKDKRGRRVGNTLRRYKVGKHFILDEDRVLTIAEACKPLGSARILDGVDAWAPMALVDGRLIVRDSRRRVCVDLRRKG